MGMLRTLILLPFFWIAASFAASPSKSIEAQKGKVVSDGAMVYKSPDFDSPVIAYLQVGQIYTMSVNKFNVAFYKIRVNNQLGYVADTDVVASGGGGAKKKPSAKDKSDGKKDSKKTAKPELKKPKKRRSYSLTQYVGPSFYTVSFKEKAGGAQRTESLFMFGIKLSGPNLLVSGATPSELNLLIYPDAPSYYDKLTGESATGFNLLFDGLLISTIDSSKDRMVHVGFGPMMRYSRFAVKLGGKSLDLQSINLGAAFDFGMGMRFGPVSIKLDAKYYWEKEQFPAFGGALQYEF